MKKFWLSVKLYLMYIIILLSLEHLPKKIYFSVKFENKKIYFGGTIPVVNTIAEISRNVTFASLIKSKSIHKILKKNINQAIKTKFFFMKKIIKIYLRLVLLILIIERNFLNIMILTILSILTPL